MPLPLLSLFSQAEDFFFAAISKSCFDFDGRASVYLTDIPSESLNLVILKKNDGFIKDILIECSSLFSQNNIPWGIVIPEHLLNADLQNILKSQNINFKENSIALYFDLKKSLSPLATDKTVDIRCVNTNLRDWMTPLGEAFESTPKVTTLYRKIHEKALENKISLHHFSLYKNKVPVSSLTISFHQGMARIDDVGTAPAYQKRGYATHLIHYALQTIKERRSPYCFLEASETGLSVYQKIGFISLFTNRIYSPAKN